MQDKLRYLLTHRPEFALWKEDDEEWFCGLAGRRNLKTASDRSEKLQRLLGDSCSALSQMDPQRSPLPDLVAAILRYADCPVELDELVNVIAELKGIREQTLRPSSRREEEDRRGLPEPASRQAGQDAELEQRERLRRLWAEISELPPRQRFALLMNLKDEGGRDLTSLLPLTGVCSFAEIAATLNLSVERLAELMQGLPLDDATIATHLNITRQQVINLRKSARERLARRMPLG